MHPPPIRATTATPTVTGMEVDRTAPHHALYLGFAIVAIVNALMGFISSVPALAVMWSVNRLVQGVGVGASTKMLTAWLNLPSCVARPVLGTKVDVCERRRVPRASRLRAHRHNSRLPSRTHCTRTRRYSMGSAHAFHAALVANRCVHRRHVGAARGRQS